MSVQRLSLRWERGKANRLEPLREVHRLPEPGRISGLKAGKSRGRPCRARHPLGHSLCLRRGDLPATDPDACGKETDEEQRDDAERCQSLLSHGPHPELEWTGSKVINSVFAGKRDHVPIPRTAWGR